MTPDRPAHGVQVKPCAPHLYPPCEPRRPSKALCETGANPSARDEAEPLEGAAVRSPSTTANPGASDPHPVVSMTAGPPASQHHEMLSMDYHDNGLRYHCSPTSPLNLCLVHWPTMSANNEHEGKVPAIDDAPPGIHREYALSMSPGRPRPRRASPTKARTTHPAEYPSHRPRARRRVKPRRRPRTRPRTRPRPSRAAAASRKITYTKPKGASSQGDACVIARATAWPAAMELKPVPPSLATFSRVRVYALNIIALHLPPLPPTPPLASHLNHHPPNDG